MPEHLLSYAAAGISWTAATAKLPALRHPDPASRMFGWFLIILSLGLSLRLPSVTAQISRYSGVPHLAWLLGAYLFLAACLAVHGFLLLLERSVPHARRAIHRRGLALAATYGVMALLFSAVPTDHQRGDFLDVATADQAAAACVLVYLAVLGSGMGWMAHVLWRHATRAAEPALRAGLTLMELSIGLGLVAILLLTGWITIRPLQDLSLSWDPRLACRAIGSSAIACYMLGVTLPAWLPPLTRSVGRYRTHRRLYRLWRTLTRTNRQIPVLLGRARPADILHVGDLDLRLYRRVIEIRYGLLALRRYRDPYRFGIMRRRHRTEFRDSTDCDAVAEALALAVALRATADGRVASDSTPPMSVPAPGGADPESDAAFLLRVARSWRRFGVQRHVPIVRVP